MCLGTMCIGIGSYKGVFVTQKACCINEGIFTTCHEIGGAAMPHVVMANLAHTCYFASSAGKTASASSVWGGTYNYLSGGVTSPESVEIATAEISAEEMKKLIEAYDSDIVLGDDPSQWIKIISHDGAYSSDIGYASVVRIGNKEIRGNKFRGEVCDYRLRSHCFTVKYVK